MKPYPLKLIPVLLSLIILQSCVDKPGVWENEKIAAGKRSDFHELTDDALYWLKANKYKRMKFIMSKELNRDSQTERTIEHLSNYLNDNKYALFEEYYIINKWRNADTVNSADKGVNRYSLIYHNPEQEMYVAFFLPKAGANKYMITLVYSKYSYGWKISDMDVAPYTFNGKTAPELYKLAKENYSKNYLIDAVNNAALANNCIAPVNIWRYPVEDSLHTFYGDIINEANTKYIFPFTINEVPTKPRIIRVYTQTNSEGTFPIVHYLTSVNLKDTLAIKNENLLIRKVIGKIMPGIDKDKKYVYYTAFNQKPRSDKEVDRFEMTEKVQ
ncbi:hypothetical protein KXD93_21400 [Mucilaginibacter sp. BJC16-A38]|uniref:hypothetical protein n=1 Tax=Mucilaginibacter phenanthrenivorans TaxID=1234842 RepID=UPI0021572311|nr:hypothetical protein [Mucilaginibacter phenanthrenivorans]MCR8560222.1 hypothetical protein [Mucilaginibacter phenanthrenivorans]